VAKSTKIKFLLFRQGYHIVAFMHRITCSPTLLCYDITTMSKRMETGYIGIDDDNELIVTLSRVEDSVRGLGKFRVGGKNSDTILRIIDPDINSKWSVIGIQSGKYGPRIFVSYMSPRKIKAAKKIYCPLTKDRKKPVVQRKKSASRLRVKQQ